MGQVLSAYTAALIVFSFAEATFAASPSFSRVEKIAAHSDIIPKKIWLAHFRTNFVLGYCKQLKLMQTCYGVSEKQCEHDVTEFLPQGRQATRLPGVRKHCNLDYINGFACCEFHWREYLSGKPHSRL